VKEGHRSGCPFDLRLCGATPPSPLPPAPRPTGGIALPPGCAGVEQYSTNFPLAPEGEGKGTVWKWTLLHFHNHY